MSIEIPDACTLPTAERPLRLAEFEALFATAVRTVETESPTHARMRLTGPAGLTATVRDLTARETECCSFFTFTVTPEPAGDGEALTLDVQVPAAYAEVLAALTALAVRDRVGVWQQMLQNAERREALPGTGVALRLEVRMPAEAADTMAAVLGSPR